MSEAVTDAVVRAVNAPPLEKRGHTLDPEAMAAHMQPEAAPLIRLLSDRALTALVSSHESDDKRAIEAQKSYRLWHWLGISARYGIIILGILALSFTQPLRRFVGEDLKLWLGIALILQLTLFLLDSLITLYMRTKRPLERWMRLRAYAEAKRLALFDCIMQRQQIVQDGELPVLALKLELVVRYLLEPQLDYFTTRARQLARGTGLNRMSILILGLVLIYTVVQIALGLAALTGLYSPGVSFDPELAMGRALIGAAFAVLLATTTMAKMDERNALRYAQTADNLKVLAATYLPRAREAAALGDEASVDAFVRLVSEQVGFGAADWLSIEDMKQIAASIEPTRPIVDITTARRFLLALGRPGPGMKTPAATRAPARNDGVTA